ncbi:MAG: hypothetical protein ACP5SH_27145 [Syntrophobacteraceae bacterium]
MVKENAEFYSAGGVYAGLLATPPKGYYVTETTGDARAPVSTLEPLGDTRWS